MDVPIHPVGIGPVALDRHRRESPLLDETPSDLRAGGVEIAGAMRGFSQQDHRGVADQVEQHLIGRHTVLRGQRCQPDNPDLGEVRVSRGGGCPGRRSYRGRGGTQ